MNRKYRPPEGHGEHLYSSFMSKLSFYSWIEDLQTSQNRAPTYWGARRHLELRMRTTAPRRSMWAGTTHERSGRPGAGAVGMAQGVRSAPGMRHWPQSGADGCQSFAPDWTLSYHSTHDYIHVFMIDIFTSIHYSWWVEGVTIHNHDRYRVWLFIIMIERGSVYS